MKYSPFPCISYPKFFIKTCGLDQCSPNEADILDSGAQLVKKAFRYHSPLLPFGYIKDLICENCKCQVLPMLEIAYVKIAYVEYYTITYAKIA